VLLRRDHREIFCSIEFSTLTGTCCSSLSETTNVPELMLAGGMSLTRSEAGIVLFAGVVGIVTLVCRSLLSSKSWSNDAPRVLILRSGTGLLAAAAVPPLLAAVLLPAPRRRRLLELESETDINFLSKEC
jgi:hypothetical protein